MLKSPAKAPPRESDHFYQFHLYKGWWETSYSENPLAEWECVKVGFLSLIKTKIPVGLCLNWGGYMWRRQNVMAPVGKWALKPHTFHQKLAPHWEFASTMVGQPIWSLPGSGNTHCSQSLQWRGPLASRSAVHEETHEGFSNKILFSSTVFPNLIYMIITSVEKKYNFTSERYNIILTTTSPLLNSLQLPIGCYQINVTHHWVRSFARNSLPAEYQRTKDDDLAGKGGQEPGILPKCLRREKNTN